MCSQLTRVEVSSACALLNSISSSTVIDPPSKDRSHSEESVVSSMLNSVSYDRVTNSGRTIAIFHSLNSGIDAITSSYIMSGTDLATSPPRA